MVTQNLFEKLLRVPRNNSQYIILTRSPNSVLQIRNLGVQLFPKHLAYFLDAYNKATKEQYGYLLIDLHPSGNSELRLRSNIFPGENPVVFLPAII